MTGPRETRVGGRLAAWLVLVWVLGVLTYGLWWRQAPVGTADSRGYLEVAHDLADGRLDQLHFRSPGYPLLLWLTGCVDYQPTRLLFWVSLLLHGAAAWSLVALLRRLRFSARAALLGSVILWLPPLVQPAAYVLSENLTQLLLVSGVAALLRGLWEHRLLPLAVSGVVFGLAALCRPAYQLAAVVLAAALALLAWMAPSSGRWRSRLPRVAGALIAGSFVVIGGFGLVNYTRFGYFGISPGNLGYALSSKTVAVLERLPERYAAEREVLIAARDAELVIRGSSHTAEQYLPAARPGLAKASGLKGLELEALIAHLNLILIARAPLNFLLHVFQSIPGYWFPTSRELAIGGSRIVQLFWSALHFLWIGFFALQLIVLGGVSILVLSRRYLGSGLDRFSRSLPVEPQELTTYVLAGTVVAYTMMVSCVVHHGEGRFRTPTDFLIVLMCFIGARIWWRWIKAGAIPTAAAG